VTPEDVAGIVRACREAERPGDEPLFWGLKTGEPEPAMEDGRHAE